MWIARFELRMSKLWYSEDSRNLNSGLTGIQSDLTGICVLRVEKCSSLRFCKGSWFLARQDLPPYKYKGSRPIEGIHLQSSKINLSLCFISFYSEFYLYPNLLFFLLRCTLIRVQSLIEYHYLIDHHLYIVTDLIQRIGLGVKLNHGWIDKSSVPRRIEI